jgi:cysteinyl-tRNA synthetase
VSDFRAQIAGAIGRRATIRLCEGDGGRRDLLGVLQSETELINRNGEVKTFNPDEIVALRLIPVFNRRDSAPSPLKIYNTQSRTLQEVNGRDGVVHIYCCGPTVYRDAHVGNLRTFLLADLINRTLTLTGLDVRLVQNITDVGHMADDIQPDDIQSGDVQAEKVGNGPAEDKLLAEAARTKVDPFEIARRYEARFHEDLTALNVIPADSYPKASETIEEMITAIADLLAKGNAYIGSDGTIYFAAQSVPSYGAISGNKLDSLKPGYRYEFSDEGGKLFHADWALWKLAAGRTQMIWDSPWGAGFPGWHIECSVMSINLLAGRVDLHVGGIDLRFPHHENERAQSNSLTGNETVATWVHGEHLLFEGRKMSKSAGNVVLLNDIIDRGLDPLALRFSLMENRYRSQMDLSWAALEAANSTLRRWRKLMAQWGEGDTLKFDQEISDSFTTDIDTPRALQRLRQLEKDSTVGVIDKRAIFLFADQVLGLELDRPEVVKPLSDDLLKLLEERVQARAEKDWTRSDALRLQLESAGLEIADGKDGQSWSWR